MRRALLTLCTAAAIASITAATAAAMQFGGWSAAASAESVAGTSGSLNTSVLEGCPFVSQRGDVLYFASNRAGSTPVLGGTAPSVDIWYSVRTESGGWSDPVNFAAVNSPFTEVCPAAHRNGKDFLFVSNRDGYCGSARNADLYRTRLHYGSGTWATPENLGCTVNSAADEASPYLLEDELYFGSRRAGGYSSAGDGAITGDADIYVSPFDGESFGAPALAPGLDTGQDDFRPNLRRDGLEIFFDSNRTGSLGGNDIWTSTRASTSDPWSTPTNLVVNTAASEDRPSLSWDGATLYFGSNRTGEGSFDLYVTTRAKLTGP
jgi:Tol biopolymer transport system component